MVADRSPQEKGQCRTGSMDQPAAAGGGIGNVELMNVGWSERGDRARGRRVGNVECSMFNDECSMFKILMRPANSAFPP